MQKVFLAFLFLWAVAWQPLQAQKPTNDLSGKQKQCFSEKCTSLGLYNPQFFYQNKINITRYQELKKAGVDLEQMSRRWNGFTPLEHVLLAPYVVKGRVVGVEDAPASFGKYQIVYSVAVEKTIAGKDLPSTIEVYSQSTGGGNFFFNYNSEPVLQLGEEVVLYLNEALVKPYQPLERRPGMPHYEEISLKPAQQQPQPEPKQIFVASLKYNIKNGQLHDAWNRPFAKLDEFTKQARQVFKINQSRKFYSRSYC